MQLPQTLPPTLCYAPVNCGDIESVIFVTLGGGNVMGRPSHDPNTVNKMFGTESRGESADERDPDASRDSEDRDRWLLDNVPPHHD